MYKVSAIFCKNSPNLQLNTQFYKSLFRNHHKYICTYNKKILFQS